MKILDLFKNNIVLVYITILSILFISSFFITDKFLSSSKIQNADSEASTIVEKCKTIGEQCYAEEFGSLTQNNEIPFVIATLEKVMELDGAARGCHLIAHSISTEEAFKDINNWEKAVKNLPIQMCTGGFLHGIFEARAATETDLELNEVTIPEICGKVKEITKSNDQNCSHILGHLLLITNSLDINAANSICSKLPDILRHECHSGVYMENETRTMIVDHKIGEHIPWNTESTRNQQELCENAPDFESSLACWREIAHMYAYIGNSDPIQLYNYCQYARDTRFIDLCYLHGTGIILSSSDFNEARLPSICRAYIENEDQYSKCIIHALGSLISSSIHYSDRAKKLCLSTPQRFRTECVINYSKKLLETIDNKDLDMYCSDLEYPYKDVCRNSRFN